MGWSSGTYVAEALTATIMKNVQDEKTRSKLYKGMLEALTDNDWDNLDEVESIDPLLDHQIKLYYKRKYKK